MSFIKIRLAACAFLMAAASTSAAHGYEVTKANLSTPGAPVGFRAVYGVIEFKVDRANSIANTKRLWGEIARSRFGASTRRGNYVVTVEVKKGEEVLGRQIIASYNISSVTTSTPILGGVFGYENATREVLQESATQWSGRVFPEEVLIESSNNTLKVELATYYAEDDSFTPKLFGAAAELVNEVRGLPALQSALSFATPAVLNLSGLLDTQLFGAEKKKLVNRASDSVLMAFLKAGDANAPPNIVRYDLMASGNAEPQMQVRVHFKTVPSRFKFDPDKGEFVFPDATNILTLASIGKRPLVDALKTTSADSSLRNFLGAWLGGEGYKGADIATRCADLRVELSKHFSSRDVAATYWALLQTYSNSLKKSNGEYVECINSVKTQYGQMKLLFTEFE